MPVKADPSIREIEQRLRQAYGPQGWWPSETTFETVVGAVLTQGTAWSNVERAMAGLREAGALSPSVLSALPVEELEELIRPAGFFTRKARTLKRVVAAAREAVETAPASEPIDAPPASAGPIETAPASGSIETAPASAGPIETAPASGSIDAAFDAFLRLPAAGLRGALLAVDGVGPETADSILLYAAGRPSFPVDTYARRVLGRHGAIEEGAAYESVSDAVVRALDREPAALNEFHALIVRVGKDFCGTEERCRGCPLDGISRALSRD